MARGLLAQAALRCAMRQGPGLSRAASIHLLDLLRVSADRERARGDILRAWSALGGAVASKGPGAFNGNGGLPGERVRLAVAIVERHYADGNSGVRAVARRVGLSPATFLRQFLQVTGGPFAAFVLAVRMRRAKQFLQEPALSIKEVAAKTGYAHPANFTRAFKGYFGVSPTAFRHGCWAQTAAIAGSAHAGSQWMSAGGLRKRALAANGPIRPPVRDNRA